MRLGIDAMGGDYAPLECIRGAKLFCQENNSGKYELVLFGDVEKMRPMLEAEGEADSCISLVHTTEVIEMGESPTRALVAKPNSSMAIGFQYLKEGKIDAFASAGNTGAMLVGAMYSVKTIPGVLRPALSTLVPHENGKTGLLLDVGANADAKPEMLNQFALMGALYLKHVYHVDNPRVALMNIGEEEGKGNKLAQETYSVLKDNDKINFIGNVEGRDLLRDMADVMVTDGFTGNIILKLAESFYDLIKSRKIHDPYFDSFNYENYGGTAILGADAPVIVAHGISNAVAFKNMISLSREIISSNLVNIFKEAFINNQILQD
ncbi:MAG TPA: phosphate acyltransferase PlsX [Bacteroidetes bacterium]|nr:phosphate acyltransferase PlsX [Bacteroidota bacterium]